MLASKPVMSYRLDSAIHNNATEDILKRLEWSWHKPLNLMEDVYLPARNKSFLR